MRVCVTVICVVCLIVVSQMWCVSVDVVCVCRYGACLYLRCVSVDVVVCHICVGCVCVCPVVVVSITAADLFI